MPDRDINPIFFDPRRRRWPWIVRIVTALSIVGTLVLILFGVSVLGAPMLQMVTIPRPKFLPQPDSLVPGLKGREKSVRNYVAAKAEQRLRERIRARKAVPLKSVQALQRPVVAGFYVNWQSTSLSSLRAHVGELTHLMPEWLHLTKTGDGMVNLGTELNDPTAADLARKNGVAIVPILNNYYGDGWNFDSLHQMLHRPAWRSAVIAQVHDFLIKNHYQGINIDLETERTDDRDALTDFVGAMSDALRPDGLLVTVCVPVDDDAFDVGALARESDFIIPMLYDEHYESGEPGPIASQGWYEEQLAKVMQEAPADKVVLAVGNYAYDWVVGKKGADSPTFGQAVMTAKESADGTDGRIEMDPQSRNPRFTYEEDGKRHEVWMLDAVTSYNELKAAAKYPVLGRALWYMGSEDPSIWSFFGRSDVMSPPAELETVRYPFEVNFEGEGEILDVAAMPTDGQRSLSVGADGQIVRESYTQYPTTCVIRRSGFVPKTVALTFDDGPDPEWTPQILDILRQKGVSATFFVIGAHVKSDPKLLKRIWDEGHEVGNHTFFHPNVAAVSDIRSRFELDATQRAIEAEIGRSTPLFRAPYLADAEPSTLEEVLPLIQAKKLGYLTIGESIDPEDWDTEHHITADQIVARVLRDRNAGNMILLHDAGGDREETVKALPEIIDRLRALGYRFETVSQIMGYKNRDNLFPAVSNQDRFLVGADRIVFEGAFWSERLFYIAFWLSILLGVAKIAVTVPLALIQARRARRARFDPNYQPSVSVVIAAYNEAAVIRRTIHSVLRSDYPDLEVIVVDDGSTDGTSEVVDREFGGNAKVTLNQKPNGGKACALNLGIAKVRSEIIVSLDADTLFLRNTIPNLVRHFENDNVGAVSGNVKVGNRSNLLTQWQSIEYITSQNFDRRAFDVMNCMTVVPGAVGAWRRSDVIDVGGYSRDTLAEDMDLTWRIRLAGKRIVTENDALAYTEAPEGLGGFSRQRFRWAFGTMQCLWKHRGAMLRAKYGVFGMFALPSLFVNQILFQAVAPAIDLALIIALFAGNLPQLLFYYAMFLVIEMVGALFAFSMDRERKLPIFLLMLQRFVYRQIMIYVILRSIATALRGMRTGWGSVERKGTARAPG